MAKRKASVKKASRKSKRKPSKSKSRSGGKRSAKPKTKKVKTKRARTTKSKEPSLCTTSKETTSDVVGTAEKNISSASATMNPISSEVMQTHSFDAVDEEDNVKSGDEFGSEDFDEQDQDEGYF